VIGTPFLRTQLVIQRSEQQCSDGLVSLTSASLGFAVPRQSFPTRVVPYCHIDPSAFMNANLGIFACNAAESPMSPTRCTHGQIVRSFLAGTTAWSSIGTVSTSDPYLSKYGGMFFALMIPAAATSGI